MSIIKIHPALLLAGSMPQVAQHTHTLLTQLFCPDKGCGTCWQCRSIANKQHPHIITITPSKGYTRADLQPIFDTIIFQLEPESHFFFIIQHADQLTTACANSLLKSLEEPPRGYHFILWATNHQLVLPTIRSRSLLYSLSTAAIPELQPFLNHFTNLTSDPLAFWQELEKIALSEAEHLALVQQLFAYVLSKGPTGYRTYSTIISWCSHAIQEGIASGSSKLWWRNVYLQIHGK